MTSRLSSKLLQTMKKIYILGALAVAATALFSCNKEQDVVTPEEPKGIPFEITAGTVETKTVNDAIHTTWVSGDQINLFHAENGSEPYTYVSDGAFEASEDGSAVSFTGNLGEALDGEKKYDWYAIYPYVAPGVNTPASFADVVIGSAADGAQTQTAGGSKAHLAGVNYPLAGRQLNKAASTKPTLEMKQIASVVEFNVTNKTAAAFKVTKIEFSCPDNEDGLVGTFTINFSTPTPSFTAGNTNKTATLNVSGDSNIAVDGSSTYYLAIKPFTAAAGTKVSITVYTDVAGSTTFNNFFPNAFEFEANKIHTFNVNYNTTSVGLAELKYNNTTWLGTQSIALPALSDGTNVSESFQKESPIWVTSHKNAGNNAPIVWNTSGSYDLRIYKKNTLVVGSFNNKVITKITFSSASDMTKLSADCGTYAGTNKTWTGRSATVVFTLAEDASVMRINAINVFYQDAEESEHMMTVPTTSFTIPYNATSFAIPICVANATGLDATSGSTGFTSATPSVANGVIDVELEENPSYSPRNIVVNVSSTNPEVSAPVTITQVGAPVTSISAIKSLYSSSAVPFTATLTNALVTLVPGTGTFFMEDASGGIKGYFSAHGLLAGDLINGTVTGTVNKNSGNFQLTALDYSGATVTHDNTVTPTTLTASTLSDNFASYESRFIRVEGVEVSAVSSKNLTLDGIDGFIVYNNSDLALPVGSQFNAVGPATYYNATKEIAVYTVEESDRLSIVPTITASNQTVAVGGHVTITPTSNSTGSFTFESLDTGKATVDENTGEVTGIAAGNVTIRINQAAVGGGSYWAAGTKDVTVEVTAGTKKYNKVDVLTSGKTYLIVYSTAGKALPHPGSSASTLTPVSVTITDNAITRDATTQACEFVITTTTIESTSVQVITYVEEATTYHLRGYNGSSTKGNLGRYTGAPTVLNDTNYRVWHVSTTTSYGSFNINNHNVDSGNRSIIYNTTGPKFGDYLTSNLNGTQYFNVDLYQLED